MYGSFLSGALVGMVFSGAIAFAVYALPAAYSTGITKAKAIEIALSEIPGEVLEVERGTYHGIPIYEIEIQGAAGADMEIKLSRKDGEVILVEREGLKCDTE